MKKIGYLGDGPSGGLGQIKFFAADPGVPYTIADGQVLDPASYPSLEVAWATQAKNMSLVDTGFTAGSYADFSPCVGNGGEVVFVDQLLNLWRSADGKTGWTTSTNLQSVRGSNWDLPSGIISRIKWSGSYYLVVAVYPNNVDGSLEYVSYTCTTWNGTWVRRAIYSTGIFTGSLDYIRYLEYDTTLGVWVLAGDGNATVHFTNPNPTTTNWTKLSGPDRTPYLMAYNGAGLYLTVRTFSIGGPNGTYTSTDLSTWTNTSAERPSVFVVYFNGKWRADKNGQTGQLRESSNGITWTDTNPTINGNGRFGYPLAGFVIDARMYVLTRTPLASNAFEGPLQLWVSSDGTNFSMMDMPAALHESTYPPNHGVIKGNDIFFGTGYRDRPNANRNVNKAYYSPGGIILPKIQPLNSGGVKAYIRTQ